MSVPYYRDREALGIALADRLPHLRSTDSVIVCLKESSLMTCIAMAKRLRAWVYLLRYETVAYPGDPRRTLGAVTPDGDFCVNPAISQSEYNNVTREFHTAVADAKRMALRRLSAQAGQGGTDSVDRRILNNRQVILASDIVSDSFLLAVAKAVCKPMRLVRTYGIAGNVTPGVYDQFRLDTDECSVLHVLSGHVFDDDHYFECGDAYTVQEQRAQAHAIAAHW